MTVSTTKTGIVLQTYDIRDSSRMVDLFTLEDGRLSFMARGARRNKSRFLNLTSPYVEGSFDLISGKSGLYLRDGILQNAHWELRQSLAHLTSARFATELLAGILVGEGEEPDLYHLLQAMLASLEKAQKSELSFLMAAYLIKLVSFAGFRPTLGHCIQCGKRIRSQPVRFAFEEGGIFCAEHGSFGESILLAPKEYDAMVQAIRCPLRDIISLYVFNKVDGQRLARIGFRYYVTHTGRNHLSTLPMMQRLRLL